jgi:hypothetical protein
VFLCEGNGERGGGRGQMHPPVSLPPTSVHSLFFISCFILLDPNSSRILLILISERKTPF